MVYDELASPDDRRQYHGHLDQMMQRHMVYHAVTEVLYVDEI